jgi:hypothetical protein
VRRLAQARIFARARSRERGRRGRVLRVDSSAEGTHADDAHERDASEEQGVLGSLCAWIASNLLRYPNSSGPWAACARRPDAFDTEERLREGIGRRIASQAQQESPERTRVQWVMRNSAVQAAAGLDARNRHKEGGEDVNA